MTSSINEFDPSQHDLGYLLTAYADGQLAPKGVQWVEQQLTERPELKLRLDEIRAVQQTLRSGLAGLEFPLALDDVRRASVLAEARRRPVANRKIRFSFHLPTIVGLAAACLTVAVVLEGSRSLGMSPKMRAKSDVADRWRNEELTVTALLATDEKGGAGGFASPAPGAAPRPLTVDAPSSKALYANGDPAAAGKSGGDGFELAQQGNGHEEEKYDRVAIVAGEPLVASSLKMKRGRDQYKDLGGRAGTGANAQAATGPAAPLIVAGPPEKMSSQDALRKDWQLEKRKRAGIASGAENEPDLDIPDPSTGNSERVAAGKLATAPVTTPAPDGFTRLNDTLAYNGKLDSRLPASETNKKQSPAEQTAAPAAAPAAAAASRPVVKPAKPQAAGPQLAQREKSEARSEPLERVREEIHKSLTPQDKLLVVDGKTGKVQALADASAGRQQQRQLQQAQAADQETDGIVHGDGRDTAEQAKEKSAAGQDFQRAEAQQQLMQDSTDNQQRFAEGKKSGHIYLRQMKQTDIDARRAAPMSRPAGRQHDAATNRALLSESLSMSGLGNAMTLLNTVAGDADVVVGQNGLALLGVDNVHLQVQNLNRGQILLQVARGVGLQVTPVDGQLELDRPCGQLDPTSSFGYDHEAFRSLFGTAPMLATADDARSTFALDAETASYDRARAQIAAGQPIDPTAIRPEQFINAMPMDYPPASGAEAFTLYAEAASAPFSLPSLRQNGDEPIAAPAWAARTALVAIGVVARPAGADERRPLHLTLAIDCSGSMGREGGLSRVQTGLAELVSHLRADDTVALVAFSDQARLVLPATTGSERVRITAAIAGLTADGATNAVDGLGLAYQVAAESVAPGAESRVVLASDGATLAGPGDLVETVLARVRAHRERGVSLLVVGSGSGSYQAAALERLANRADGQQVFLASDEDAKRIFSGRLLPERLGVLAKDAKVQVTWNPQRVSHARLIGYEQRRLAHTDFRNDAVDAGELSHDAQVTALYEVLLIDGATGPLGSAAVRYHDTRLQQVRELACPLPGTVLKAQASDRLRLLACAAETAEWLQKGWWSNVRLPAPERIIAELTRCPQPAARELEDMVRRANQSEGGKP